MDRKKILESPLNEIVKDLRVCTKEIGLDLNPVKNGLGPSYDFSR